MILTERILNLAGILLEDLNQMWEKGYNTIPKEKFMDIVKLDPQTSDKKPGKFFKELLRFVDDSRLESKKEDFKEIMNYCYENASVSKHIAWLFNLSLSNNLKTEDLYKAKEYLEVFEANNIGKSLQSFTSLPMLYTSIRKYVDEDYADDIEDVEEEERESGEEKPIAEKVYKDGRWLVIVPKNYEASCKYGAGTRWCTASKQTSEYFTNYSADGPLYVVIDREERDKENRQIKYQFHFESEQFMDVMDRQIDVDVFFSDIMTDGLKKFFLKAVHKGEIIKEYKVDKEDVTDLFPGDERSFAKEVLNGDWHYDIDEYLPVKDIIEYYSFNTENGTYIEFLLDQYNLLEELNSDEYDDLYDFLLRFEHPIVEAINLSVQQAYTSGCESATADKAYSSIIAAVEYTFNVKNFDGEYFTLVFNAEKHPASFFYPDNPMKYFHDISYYADDSAILFSQPYHGYDETPTDKDFNETFYDIIHSINMPRKQEDHEDQLRLPGMERILELSK